MRPALMTSKAIIHSSMLIEVTSHLSTVLLNSLSASLMKCTAAYSPPLHSGPRVPLVFRSGPLPCRHHKWSPRKTGRCPADRSSVRIAVVLKSRRAPPPPPPATHRPDCGCEDAVSCPKLLPTTPATDADASLPRIGPPATIYDTVVRRLGTPPE